MTVDFTEAAGAGSMAGWKTAAYAPIFHLESLEQKFNIDLPEQIFWRNGA